MAMPSQQIFDRNNGQVYTETTVAARSSLNSKPWITAANGSTNGLSGHKQSKGAATLLDMCWRQLCIHSAGLKSRHFENIDWMIARKLWARLHRNDLVSVSVWIAFVQAYCEEILESRPDGLMYHYSSPRLPSHALQAKIPSKALVPQLNHVHSPTFHWINMLCLFDTPMQRTEWFKLANLTNLGALYVQNSTVDFGLVDDTVVKRWSNEVQENGAFPALKLILFRNQRSLTMGILEYLKEFTALRVFHMTGPTFRSLDITHSIEDSRWTWMSESSLCLKLCSMWFSAQSHTSLIPDLYLAVHRYDTNGNLKDEKPLLRIISGTDPISNVAGRQDQLWFELSPGHTETGQLKRPSSPIQDAGGKRQQNRLKIAEGSERYVRDIWQDILG